MKSIRKKLSYTQIIALSFALVILGGTLILCLPISSRSGEWTPFIDALFTATSSTCVTGLVVLDTYTYWNVFGQIIILILIQVGGLGMMTCISILAIAMKKKFTLGERRLLMQSAGSLQIGGVIKLLRRIIKGTAIFELSGAAILSFVFVPDMGFFKGVWNALFHSISAFCNAGFDLLGGFMPFGSLAGSPYAGNPAVILTLAFLIIIGGMGFIVWSDIAANKFKFKKYSLHSKLVLCTSGVLIVGGTVLFYLFETDNTLKDMSFPQKLMTSFFQAVTPRTAGYADVNMAEITDSSKVLTNLLMLIGGSPGSTAGGIKVTTFAVLAMAALSAARKKRSVRVFKHRLDSDTVMQAGAVFFIYLFALVVAVTSMAAFEPHALNDIVLEATSAIGTVGLSTGITPALGVGSHLILIILMFAGRVGGLTLVLTLSARRKNVPLERPVGHVLIG